MAYRLTWDELVHGPFRPVIEKALLLEVGEKLTFDAEPISVKMAEQRVREYFRFMDEKDPDTAYARMFIVRPLFGLGKVEVERRFPAGGLVISIDPQGDTQ